jgi:methyltransferase (TIGR00027 family)
MSVVQDISTPIGMAATGLGVALSRAEESERGDRLFTDPWARAFVGAAGGPVVSADEAAPFAAGYFALRTRWFDDAVATAVAGGVRQVVVLAAGLDTRAFRLGLPASTLLLEVDLPGVVAFKEDVLARHDALPDCRRTALAADLREDVGPLLTAAGLRPDRPTAWIVEGLLPYLTAAAGDSLLDRIGALSAPGSHLALEHINRATLDLPPIRAMLEALADEGAAWRSGVDDPRAWLAAHGWSATLQPVADLAHAAGRPVPRGMDPAFVGEARCWLAHARRTGGGGA